MDTKLIATINYITIKLGTTDISRKKLNLLLYYCQAWHLVLTAENNNQSKLEKLSLFNTDFIAGIHGPLIQNLNYKYATSIFKHQLNYVLSSDELDTINQVINQYGALNANELEAIATKEFPWLNARSNLKSNQPSNNIISKKDIFDFYALKLT